MDCSNIIWGDTNKMNLWEVVIVAKGGSAILPHLEKHFYIVGCDSKKKAEKLAVELHLQKFSQPANLTVEAIQKLDLVNPTIAVWYNKCEIY